jgi:hypothetical protein
MPANSLPPVIEIVPSGRTPNLTPGAAAVLLQILRKEHERIAAEPRREAA